MSQDDIQEVVQTGERLPADMFDPSLLTDDEDLLQLPTFDGEKLVDQGEE